MYHRILPRNDVRFAVEEPGMIATPETFESHLLHVKSLFDVISLSGWLALREQHQVLPKKACAITFDDGWLDNYEFALPLLIKHQVPATLFVVADMIGTQREFWPNRLSRLLPNVDVLTCTNPLIDWLFSHKAINKMSVYDAETMANIIHLCKTQPDPWLHQQLDNLESTLKLTPDNKPGLMNWNQLRELQDSGLVEIGSHTCNHLRLNDRLDAAVAEEEVIRSKQVIDENLGVQTRLFCYPNGDTSPLTQTLVTQHYQGAVITHKGINNIHTSAHALQRIGIHEDISNTRIMFEARLSGLL